MVGDERPRQRAAVERLQHRRLDLEEAALVEEARGPRATSRRAQDEQLARLLVGEQVELAVAVARLDVGEAVVLVGRRAQRLRQQRPAVDAQRQLAAARAEGRALDADQVAEVEVDEPLVGVARARPCARAAGSCPERSTRSRNAALPWPRRAVSRPASAVARRRSPRRPRARRSAASTSRDRRAVPELVRERVDAGARAARSSLRRRSASRRSRPVLDLPSSARNGRETYARRATRTKTPCVMNTVLSYRRALAVLAAVLHLDPPPPDGPCALGDGAGNGVSGVIIEQVAPIVVSAVATQGRRRRKGCRPRSVAGPLSRSVMPH